MRPAPHAQAISRLVEPVDEGLESGDTPHELISRLDSGLVIMCIQHSGTKPLTQPLSYAVAVIVVMP